MLWNTKNEMPIGSGNLKRKSIGATPITPGDAGSMNRNLYLKNASRCEIEGDADRQPYGAIPQGQDQEQVSAENGDARSERSAGWP